MVFQCINIRQIPSEVLKTAVAQLDAPSDWRPGSRGFNPRRGGQLSFVEIDHEIFSTVILSLRGFNPRRGRQLSFMEIDHEIFSTVILSLPLIQEGQLSVPGERMCTILVNRLED